MKKLTIGVIALLIVVSIFFNVKLNNDLKSATVLKNTIQSELVESEKVKQSLKDDIKILENDLSESNEKVITTEDKLKSTQEEMASTKELIQLIDSKLEGSGVTIVKIDELLDENEKLKGQIAKLTTRVNEIIAESLLDKEDAETQEIVEVEETPIVINVPTKEWATDLQEVIDFIVNRKGELENASSSLPVLSLERLMINQEIEFLDEAVSDLNDVLGSINMLN